jgi:hypothetical protein
MSESSTYKTNRLSILILQDGFSFLITNPFSAPLEFGFLKVKSSQSTGELLKLIKSKIDQVFLQTHHIEELQVIYGNPQFSIVPDVYFEESHLPHYLKYSSKLIEGDDFSFDHIDSLEANTVYIPYVNINNYLFEVFGSFKFTHVLTNLIVNSTSNKNNTDDLVNVHVSHHHIYVVAYQKQNLVLANAFEYKTPEDLSYYILFSVEQLQMDRERLQLNFTGEFFNTSENEAFKILSNYIRHIRFGKSLNSNQFEDQTGFYEHFNLL